jgi:nicotinate dehydrogenase subunit B
MLHGRVVRPPSVGATLARVDETSVRGMPGLVRVVVRRNFVGVVAEKPFQAAQIAENLQVAWTPGPVIPAQGTYYAHLRADRAARDTYLLDSGDVDQAIRGASRVVSATYLHPFHMHGSVGSSCAVADVQPG